MAEAEDRAHAGPSLFRAPSSEVVTEGPEASTSVALSLGAPSVSTTAPQQTGTASLDASSPLSSSDDQSADAQPMADGPGYVVEHDEAQPNSPNFIRFLRSDGIATNWPQPGPFTDSKGAPCEWVVADDASPLKQRWLAATGKLLAERMKLPDPNSQRWRLRDFPANYCLFTHVKGKREDSYLYGSVTVTKFRTTNEFLPHAEMLCRNDNRPCHCKYCSGTKLQSAVNTQLGIYSDHQPTEPKAKSHRSSNAASSVPKRERKRPRVNETTSDTGTEPKRPTPQRRPDPVPPLRVYDGAYIAKDRERDLEESQCAFRHGEMVWCKLSPALRGGWSRDIQIEYWPAVCESRELVTDAHAVPSDTGATPGELFVGGSFQPDPPVQLEVTQHFCWRLRLLGVSDALIRQERDMMPWLNYPPPEELFEIPLSEDASFVRDWNGDSVSRPALAELHNLPRAITPFALALQIAAHVVSYWNLHDRYDAPTVKEMQTRGFVLDRDAQTELRKDAQNAWFQSLWWGAEKIWSGELVRLVIGRGDLPSDLREPSPGCEDRAFFLKITGIYRGTDDRPAVKGPIFELAPLDENGKIPSDEAEASQRIDVTIRRFMPAPPPGYYFRCLTGPREERHLVLEHIAGRYYPPAHLQVAPQPDGQPGTSSSAAHRSRSLCGLTPGGHLFMKAQNWVGDRKEALKKSERTGEEDMNRHFQGQVVEMNQPAAQTDSSAS